MSWVRWGSPCSFASMPWLKWCAEGVDVCPGSSVYVYENSDTSIVCCGCDHLEAAVGLPTEEAMVAHLRDYHVARGDHVPRQLYDSDVIERERSFLESLTPGERMLWVELAQKLHWALMEDRQNFIAMRLGGLR